LRGQAPSVNDAVAQSMLDAGITGSPAPGPGEA
jgi:hypothetical protein